jgi:hypothetical protein
VRGPAAFLGEHNQAALMEWLDISPEEVHDLERRGVLRREPDGAAAG